VWGNLGDAYYWASNQRGRPSSLSKAISLAVAASRVNPRDAVILCNLALYHAVLHEKESALSLLRRALAFDPDNPDFLFKAADTQPVRLKGCRADLIEARDCARLFRVFL
jgi:tetratricopeptide (TPR) repeat protein